jgi:phenylalanyl-tRNA synthetase beta chain
VKFLLSWMREFVQDGVPPADLARRLTSAGMPVETIAPLPPDDALLDIEVFPNRPDCMSMYGMAREMAAATGKALCPYPGDVQEDAVLAAAGTHAKVFIDDPALCGRYTARVVRGVRVGPSPDWMAQRLAALGMRPVNNVVDATNYVLWELGQPLHAFDLATLRGAQVRVRRAKPGERLVTLDGAGRTLDADMLVIADAEHAVALAGIMGGATTMVTERTTDVLLESAHFDAVSVRRTSKRLGLSTDASYRFERGADIEITATALARVADLIRQVAGGHVCPGVVECRPAAPVTRRVRVRPARTAQLMGMPLPGHDVAAALRALHFQFHETEDSFDVEVPSHRRDIEREVDLIEEVARHVGYDAVPGRLPHIQGTGSVERPGHRREARLRRGLASAGYSQAITFSFTSPAADWALRGRLDPGDPAIEPVAVANPLAADQEILRTTLLPTLLDSVARNVHRGVRDVRLYEIGRTFRRGPAPPPNHADRKHPSPGPVEEVLTLGLALTGAARPRHWSEPPRDATFFDLKGDVQAALREAGYAAAVQPLGESEALETGHAALLVCEGERIGRMGALSSSWRRTIDLRQDVFVAEVNLSRLLRLQEIVVGFTPLPRFPAVTRDLSLVVPAGTVYRLLEAAVKEAAPALVSQVTVADRYEGSELPAGTSGLTLRLLLQAADRTLSSEDVQQAQDRIVDMLAKNFGIRLRQ